MVIIQKKSSEFLQVSKKLRNCNNFCKVASDLVCKVTHGKLTSGAVVGVHLLEAGGTGTGEGLVAGEAEVAAASIVGATAIPTTWREDSQERNMVMTQGHQVQHVTIFAHV